MTVYVDDMRAKYGRLVMCHMLADTEAELLQMADAIGVARKWHQFPGTAKSHFDVCLAKRAAAIEQGAQPITMREAGRLVRARRQLPAKPAV